MPPSAPPTFTVHTAPRGPRFIAWLTKDGETGPYRSVVLVAATQEEAEARARAWAEQQTPAQA